MKILATADWHIKIGQKNVPKVWAKNRYKSLFGLITEISKDVDLHIIMGDIFDRTPTLEEVELYFDFVSSCTIETIIFDGNHCATRKGHTFLSTLIDVTNLVNPLVRIVDRIEEQAWGTILPYNRLHSSKSIEILNKSKPLFTHVRGEIPPHVKPEIDLNRLKDFPIVFAGDLHAHSNTQLNIVYPGSPVTTSFHRNEVETGYLIIDGTKWTWNTFDLPQLLRKTVTEPKEMVATTYHHTIYEIEGDISELSGIKNSELLDKKIVKRSTEATLILDGDMTITEELVEYLLYILELPKNIVDEVVRTFSDNTKTAQME